MFIGTGMKAKGIIIILNKYNINNINVNNLDVN
jgi:hypothetical protein